MSFHRPRPALRRRVALLVLLLGLGAGLPGDRAVATASTHDPQHAYLVRQKNRVAVPSEYRPLTFDEFLALPAVPAVYEPSDWRTVLTLSRWAVSLEGYIAQALPVPDGRTYRRPALNGDIHGRRLNPAASRPGGTGSRSSPR